MPKFIDITGKKYGRLTVLERDFSKGKKRTYWKCQCECGNQTIVDGVKLKNGSTKSCGCLNDENRKKHIELFTKHNMRNSPLYDVWCGLRSRCERESNSSYKYYGAKGIKVCDDWKGANGFQKFYEWSLNNGYGIGLTIDRINVNGDYEPKNCRWVSMKTQSNNRTNNRYITYYGQTRTLTEWCEKFDLNYSIMYHRIYDLEIPFEIAKNMGGFPTIMFRGKKTDLRSISKKYNLQYKELLKLILIEDRDIEFAIKLLTKKGCG